MKKIFIALVLSCFALSARAMDVIRYYELAYTSTGYNSTVMWYGVNGESDVSQQMTAIRAGGSLNGVAIYSACLVHGGNVASIEAGNYYVVSQCYQAPSSTVAAYISGWQLGLDSDSSHVLRRDGSWGNTESLFPNGYVFRAFLNANYTTTSFVAGNYFPLTGTVVNSVTSPSAKNGSITIIGQAGTIRNWTIAGDSVAAAEHDTIVLKYSLDSGKTWNLSTLKVIFGGAAVSQPVSSDNTHTLAVTEGEFISAQMTANSTSSQLGNAASCIEFDAKLQ